MTSPARLLPAAGFALLCLVLALGLRQGADSSRRACHRLCILWRYHTHRDLDRSRRETGITAYDVRHIETGADETDDANWTVEDNAWTSGALLYTITILDNGTQYDVQVRAVNSNGDGTWVRHQDRYAGAPRSHYRFRSR